MMVNLLDDSNFHRQTVVMTRLIEMIIQNPVFGIFCIISMLVHPTSQCFTNIQKSTECTFYAVNDIFSRTVQRVKRFKRGVFLEVRVWTTYKEITTAWSCHSRSHLWTVHS